MEFLRALQYYKKEHLLSPPMGIEPVFKNEEDVMNAFIDILKNNLRVLIYGDYDPDGGFSKKILQMGFEYLGHTNFECCPYFKRTHKIDPIAINRALAGNFDYMIICDAGSSDPQTVKRLIAQGVKIILLDHHESIFSYENFGEAHMINTTFDNRERDSDIVLSAGALTYLVVKKLCERLGRSEISSTSALALASLYADSIDMTGDLQRTIYYKAMKLDVLELPGILQSFIFPYDSVKKEFRKRPSAFTRRFLEFTVNPRINALFRGERFDLLNKLLNWKNTDDISMLDLMGSVIHYHSEISNEILLASDLLAVDELQHFVIGNLSSAAGYVNISQDLLNNYTGQVANKVAGKYKKAALVYADTNLDIKGSVRDLYGRNYLDTFRVFSGAAGHPAAFGINIPYLGLDEFLKYVRLMDSKNLINSSTNQPIIVTHNEETPSPELMSAMATYNEFSGITCPKSFISKRWFSKVDPFPSKYDLRYGWGDFTIKGEASIKRLRRGSNLILCPIKGRVYRNNRGVELRLQEVSN